MSTWSDGYVTTNGIRVHYYRTGGDKPKVILNHGFGDDGLCWTRVAKALERDYDLIMPDARGHGKSDTGKGNYAAEARVADLAGLIQALRLDRPVVGGHSMGADTSLHLAATYPQLTRGISLEDPPITMPGEQFMAGDKPVNLEDVGKMMVRFMRIFKLLPKFIGVRMARKNSPTYPDDEIIPWVDAKRRMSNDVLNSMGSMGIGMDPSAPFASLKQVTMPILLFIGDKEKGSIVSKAAAEEAVRVNSRVQVIHLEGANHDIRRCRFDGYVPALQEFLAGVYRS